ncbi:Conserved hypothetical protein [gamma proteobacterium HdN1]|nr:Conserved hypothetical protein [gamma proteobacterium HdN1]
MTPLIRRFGRTRLVALILTVIPFLVLPVLGIAWLWQTDTFLYWLFGLFLFGGTGYLLHWLITQRDARKAAATGKSISESTQPNPNWPNAANAPWQVVSGLADSVTVAEWPLSDVDRLWLLGRNTLESVARVYHPNTKSPLLELTIPNALMIIERASREMRIEISEHIPLSHQLTLGDIVRVQRWQEFAGKLEAVYRVGRAVLDPSSMLFSEFRREMGNRIMGYGAERVQLWLLQEYVRKVGYYAIELYSGRLLLSNEDPTTTTTATSKKDHQLAQRVEALISAPEPLRIMVLGRNNAGKSSLINALFGEVKAPTDTLPSTTDEIIPYQLEREGGTAALIFDTPGCDNPQLSERALKTCVLSADLILWVTPANRPDRSDERQLLAKIRQWLLKQTQRRPPPILMVMTHIDQLRPIREWKPPFDLANPRSEKARNIVEAIAAVATDLNVQPESIIPVSLAEGREYNVDDTLWAAILANEAEAERVRFTRCMDVKKREENWALIRKQLLNAGRLLLEVPKIIKP